MDTDVGFIGVGMMGLPIALNLLKAGVKLRVFNRTASKAEALVASGATQVESPGDTAAPGGVVMTMLANDEAVEAMVVGDEGLAVRLAPAFMYR
jgi:3-hydroxyisobutyrate dehydrogenase-like beta-hydroxyacid dehydrogenase